MQRENHKDLNISPASQNVDISLYQTLKNSRAFLQQNIKDKHFEEKKNSPPPPPPPPPPPTILFLTNTPNPNITCLWKQYQRFNHNQFDRSKTSLYRQSLS